MVVVKLSVNRLLELTGIELDIIHEALFNLKCEAEPEGNQLAVEVNPDRPDMFISEGVARAVRGLYDLEHGWNVSTGPDSSFEIESKAPRSRPYIAGAVVRGIDVDELFLVELMQFQEKLHDTLGRRRRKVAIGIHDLDKVIGHKLTYTYVKLDYKMIPLDGTSEMTLKDVLALTPQGKSYGKLSIDGDLHPAILDEEGNIISLPPVINSNITRLEPGTKRLFIDVTGTDPQAVNKVLDILVSTIVEGKKASIEYVKVLNSGQVTVTPLLSFKRSKLTVDYINRVLGTDLTIVDAALSLQRMRHNVDIKDDMLDVMVPPFRVDVISEIDLVEDIAIALGYNSPKLSPSNYLAEGLGSLLESTRLKRVTRDLMIGLGFTEIMTYMLVSGELLKVSGYNDNAIKVRNPVNADLDYLRPSLIPSVLSVMVTNRQRPKPIKIFEIGKVVMKGSSGPEEDLLVAAGLMDDSVSFEDIQSVAYAYLRALGLTPSTIPHRVPAFVEGRSALLLANGKPVGYVGEVDPHVLDAIRLYYPVAMFEASLRRLLEVLHGGGPGRAT